MAPEGSWPSAGIELGAECKVVGQDNEESSSLHTEGASREGSVLPVGRQEAVSCPEE